MRPTPTTTRSTLQCPHAPHMHNTAVVVAVVPLLLLLYYIIRYIYLLTERTHIRSHSQDVRHDFVRRQIIHIHENEHTRNTRRLATIHTQHTFPHPHMSIMSYMRMFNFPHLQWRSICTTSVYLSHFTRMLSENETVYI